ncbi:MAG: hypothetical protein MUE69_19470 [Myxococcota bacterium]|jgi:hypothetical protein|nr:hypothetical protein [Myxococcota bacterium]
MVVSKRPETPIKLTHLGESIVEGMFNGSPGVRELLSDRLSRPLANFEARAEVALEPLSGLIFDGGSRIDVALFGPHGQTCVACELKLGTTRLSASEFEKRFLQNGTLSHRNKRIRANMIAILERREPIPRLGDLMANINHVPHRIDENWLLVVRHEALLAWEKSRRPALSSGKIVSLEELVEAYGGREEFNILVRSRIDFDYFDRWGVKLSQERRATN